MSNENAPNDESQRPAVAGRVDRGVRPGAEARHDLNGDAELVWLWTHCRALGMRRRSDSMLIHHDVALYTAELQAALKLIVAAYDGYRGRGLAPAPAEYADLVRAINAARVVLEA